MATNLKRGDTVEWNTSQGKTRGTVEKKITSRMKIKRHKVAASKDNPEYLVKSSESGKNAAHKAEALKKVGSK
jgi:excinuclease UvrABC helicase subunit UvrB